MALNYQYKVSPDGRTVGWASTWDFDTGKPGFQTQGPHMA